MKKTDIAAVLALFVLLIGWVYLSPRLFRPSPQAEGPAGKAGTMVQGTNGPAVPAAMVESPRQAVPAAPAVVPGTGQAVPSNAGGAEAGFHAGNSPQMVSLSNASIGVTISSWGGGIVGVRLKEFPVIPSTNALELDFSAMPSLAYSGLPGLSTNYDFVVAETNNMIRVSRDTERKLRFVRSISFAKNYMVRITDEFTNLGSEPAALPEHSMNVGPMRNNKGETASMGFSDLGIDSQAKRGGEGTRYWGNGGRSLRGEPSLAESFLPKEQRGGCAWFKPPLTRWLDPEFHMKWVGETDWIAVKNKFFVQVLMPKKDEAGIAFMMNVKRTVAPGERPDVQQTWSRNVLMEEVSAAMVFEGRTLAPGESYSREIDYYVGPKKYPLLRDMGKDSIMEFGFWAPICKPLLWILNALYVVAPNYGVVIILLTILIRLVFWPVMQKSAENSRKMQELQPQLAALKEQFKNDQQQFLKKQQELFKQNKVSVLGGCLPMLIQMPVLFGLFYVLRSAVELRGAGFLWITDLSEAERLFAGFVPFWPHHVNILPILMTVVQIWQMKITPTGGDQQMQKIMLIFMPFFMLYLLYDMASGLVLYWTVSQVLAILQIVLEKNRKHKPVIAAVGKK